MKQRDKIIPSRISRLGERRWIVVVERRRLFDQNLQISEHWIHMHARFSSISDEVEFYQEHWEADHS